MDANNPSRKKARLIVLAIFVIGFAAGALSMNLYERFNPTDHRGPRGGNPTDRVITDMSKRLDLTTEQQTEIRAILDETFGKYREIRRQMDEDSEVKKYMPRFDETRLQGRDKMRAVLKPEQLPKFEEMVKELDEKRQQREQNEKRGGK
jgi:Spy/CpxP family protein refolding chaperone